MAQRIDLWTLHEIAIASALPKLTPALATFLTTTRSRTTTGSPSYTWPLGVIVVGIYGTRSLLGLERYYVFPVRVSFPGREVESALAGVLLLEPFDRRGRCEVCRVRGIYGSKAVKLVRRHWIGPENVAVAIFVDGNPEVDRRAIAVR